MPSQLVKFKTVPNPDVPGVLDIEPSELWSRRQEIKQEVVLVDVRRPDEYTGELGHVAGSQLIVLDTLPQHLQDLPKDKTIVFICRSGARSGRAVSFAKTEGFTHVYNLKGGMLLWNQLALEVEGRNQN